MQHHPRGGHTRRISLRGSGASVLLCHFRCASDAGEHGPAHTATGSAFIRALGRQRSAEAVGAAPGERRQPPYGPPALCWRACGRHQLLLRRDAGQAPARPTGAGPNTTGIGLAGRRELALCLRHLRHAPGCCDRENFGFQPGRRTLGDHRRPRSLHDLLGEAVNRAHTSANGERYPAHHFSLCGLHPHLRCHLHPGTELGPRPLPAALVGVRADPGADRLFGHASDSLAADL
mmetsp:Transcript_55721/g.133346  ORF Transcript_55721/g.133346 Transcript_55721/m.133346 type:complete len:233 (-) Transcript_55721:807-1505(-)